MSKTKFLLAVLLGVSSAVVSAAQIRKVDAKAMLQRGNESFAKTDYETAIREYALVPANAGEIYAQSLYNIGVSYYELWRTTDAIDFYRRALAVHSGRYPRASYALGVALEEQGKLAEASEAYQQSVIDSGGQFAPAHYRLGLLIARQGKSPEAAESFRQALKYPGPHVPASHNNLGVMLARLGSLKDAQHQFELALRESNGMFSDAAHNLRLCRSLLTAGSKELAAFRVSGTTH
jgi:tetratricopeptide (TPR) repeat protein